MAAADAAESPVLMSDGTLEGKRRIAVLPPEEARKIAAGEVVDRPAALVREFLDNAIDAGGKRIEVFIDAGGRRRVEVDDDGEGMDREDLELCILTHATSKIRSLEDLNSIRTLGFRGEALAAAAAVSALEIVSSGGREAWKLLAGPGGSRPLRIEPGIRNRGSSVRALGLFDTIPARKRFLKREGSEALLCRQAFIDKALAFPEIDFRFTQDGVLKLSLPQAGSCKERFAAALFGASPPGGADVLHEIYALGEGFRATLVVGGPELCRNDRRQQFVFANRRRIQDYSLLQALEYGVQGWFPNGLHPVGALYIDIDPALADFNIHPAKREARFSDPGALHHMVTTALREFFRASVRGGVPREGPVFPVFDREPHFSSRDAPGAGAYAPAAERLALEALLANPPDFAPLPGRGNSAAPLAVAEGEAPYGAEYSGGPADKAPGGSGFPAPSTAGPGGLRFIGRAFGLFLLAEKDERLYLIDQHAAHERILYDRFLSSPIARQELLVPINFEAEDLPEDRFLRARGEELAKLGIVIEEGEKGRWQITALPEGWRLSDGETLEALRDLRSAGEDMAERWAATLSCRRAVKDGDYLDDLTASALVEAALALPIPRCPHGRPIWVEISRAELYRGVKRS
ncbi:MAG: DNA mismatch repair endonuclease MutL [Treponema sp.]|jgi:DNA mismatch repair protein MutL|nr:DNA mismatch repair endonuclease MutL [Treponema sp.]